MTTLTRNEYADLLRKLYLAANNSDSDDARAPWMKGNECNRHCSLLEEIAKDMGLGENWVEGEYAPFRYTHGSLRAACDNAAALSENESERVCVYRVPDSDYYSICYMVANESDVPGSTEWGDVLSFYAHGQLAISFPSHH